MERFKICPYCKTRNKPNVFDCEGCGEDISFVKSTDEDTLEAEKKAAEDKQSTEETNSVQMVRICSECGFENPANARKCQGCGEDISDIAPAPKTAKEGIRYSLMSVNGDYAYELSDGVTILGRDEEMRDYLMSKSFVSRIHCKVEVNGDDVSIEDLGSTNGTFVNNVLIKSNTTLKVDDEIGIGGTKKNDKRQEQAAYFTVRINQCTSQESCTQ